MQEPAEFDHLPEMTPPEGDSEIWTVSQDWQSPPIKHLGGRRVFIANGFTTDGASIPRFAWPIVGHPLDVPMLGPALVHDALYSGQWTTNHAEADWCLLECMQLVGMGWIKRNVIWSAVRTCGWTVWDRHTHASVEAARQLTALV